MLGGQAIRCYEGGGADHQVLEGGGRGGDHEVLEGGGEGGRSSGAMREGGRC